LMLVQLRSLQL